MKTECAKQAEVVQEHLQLELVAMESFHTYCRELLDKGRPSDITRAASELHKRAKELLDNDVTSVQYCPPHVTFTPADVTQLSPSKLIGKLTFLNSGNAPGYIMFSSILLTTLVVRVELSDRCVSCCVCIRTVTFELGLN